MHNPFTIIKDRRNAKMRRMFDAVRPIALDEEEKARIRMTLNAFTVRHPVRDEELHRSAAPRISATLRLFRMMPALVGALVLVIVGGGISAGAENTLPGDRLYAMKVGLNEEVRALFTPSHSGKASWELARAMRRLEEAETLAARGELNENARQAIAAHFEKHVHDIAKQTAALRANDALAAATVETQLEASLRAHETALFGLVETAHGADELTMLAETVKAEAERTAEKRMEQESNMIRTHAELETLTKEARRQAETARENAALTIENRKALVSANAAENAELRFASGETRMAEAQTLFARGTYDHAFLMFRTAERTFEEAKVLAIIESTIFTTQE